MADNKNVAEIEAGPPLSVYSDATGATLDAMSRVPAECALGRSREEEDTARGRSSQQASGKKALRQAQCRPEGKS